MAEPGDHKPEVETEPAPDAAPVQDASSPLSIDPGDANFDDTVGFASPTALAGRAVQSEPTPEPPAEANLVTPPVEPWQAPEIEAPRIEAPPEAALVADAPIAPVAESPAPSFLDSTPAAQPYVPTPSREERRRMRDLEAAAPADDRMLWAYTVYALILFAVPTLGVSAAIGVLAVTGRAVKAEEPLKSHYIFQQRTLWSAAVMAVIGLVLIPIGLGVFVLFAAAVWILARGAFGLLRLKAGRAIDNPRSWLL